MVKMLATDIQATPIDIFYSYSHKDEYYRQELDKHLSSLKREGIVSSWHDRKIIPGADWNNQIITNLKNSNIILFLVSPDFLASDYCFDVEVNMAMRKHDLGELCLIPIIIRPVDWKNSPFGKFQALPKDGKPISTWKNIDEGYLDIVHGIREKIHSLEIVRQKEIKKELPITFSMKIEGTLQELNSEKIEEILSLLKELTNDATLTLSAIVSGSIILVLSGSKSGLEQLMLLNEKNLLSMHLNVNVLDITIGEPQKTESNKDKNTIDRSQPFEKSFNIYVGNLPYKISENDLRELFSEYGTVNSVSMVRDKMTGQSKGFGFVEMKNRTEALQATNGLNEFYLKGRNIKVKEATLSESRPRILRENRPSSESEKHTDNILKGIFPSIKS